MPVFFFFWGGTIIANEDINCSVKNVTALLEIATALLEKMSVEFWKAVTISR